MVIHKRIGNILPRRGFLALMVLWEAALLMAFFHSDEWGQFVLLGLHQVVWVILLCAGIVSTAEITLSPEGVTRRVLFRKTTILWNEIRQAGVLTWRPMRGYTYPMCVLVPQNGVLHTRQDDWDGNFAFQWKCVGKNVVFVYSTWASDYIGQYYGPFDFDLPNNGNKK